MPPFHDSTRLLKTLTPLITTVDSHTEGEITRLILDGTGNIPGASMMEKLAFFKSHCDHLRCRVTREPRGSREVLAAAVTEPVSPEASFGLIYMDAKRYPYLCGHATMGAVVTLARTGFLELGPGENRVLIDTPSGTMETRAHVEKGEVMSVELDMVPSFVFDTQREIRVEGFGKVKVDLVCTGGFFAMVDTAPLGLEPVLENREILVDLGMKIIAAANEQLEVWHPARPEVNTVDVTEFYDVDPGSGPQSGRGMVAYGESHMDRSPCGTGTAAKLALLHHYGKIGMDEPYVNSSPLGTRFEARLKKKTKIGNMDAVTVRIKGRAWVTGIHHFTMDRTDPFQQGYMI
ncbi:proline racemase family protein [Desulfospira joergensenii]|uniref:proline racemase family protein n=1 Tax=Desulfospira joergensenii TaxID=53329 RepID=UPI0003B3486D|nr:proline racemase family protein [Desulfospira joergensenii]